MKRLSLIFLMLLFAISAYGHGIGPGLVQVKEGDGTPDAWVTTIIVDNTALSVSGNEATIDLSGAAGGEAITFDIGDDGGDDSVDVNEIATSGDTNSIFTEPTNDKILIDLSNNWPAADSADAVAADSVTDLGIDWGTGANQVSAVDIPVDVTNFDGNLGAGDSDLKTALETIDDMTAGAGDVSAVGDCASGACLDGSSDGGSYIRVYDGDSHYGEFQVPDVAGNVTYTFPTATSTLIPDTGSANIVTVGTIATGTWEGDAIGTSYAGADLDHSNLAAVVTMADGDLINFAAVTMSGTNDEGLVLPTWGDTTPTTDQAYITFDATNDAIKVYDGGWLTFATVAAPLDAKYIVQTADATLTAEQALGALASGILYSTTTTGVVSIASEAQMEATLGIGFGASKAATSGYILVMDGTDLESVQMSGDVTIASGGATTIGANAIDSDSYVDGSIDAEHLAADIVDETKIADDGIDSEHYNADSIDNEHINWADIDNLVDEGMPIDFALTADATVSDNINIGFGATPNMTVEWLTDISGVDDVDSTVTGEGLVFAGTDAAADIKVLFENDDATYGVDLYVKDIHYSGTLTSYGTADAYLELRNNSGGYTASSGYALYVDAGTWKAYDGTEQAIVFEGTSPTWTGTSHDFTGVTNFLLPTAAADASGEISMSAGNQLKWHDGAKVITIDTTPTTDNYVLKYDNATATFTLEADETGGTPAWDTITDSTGAMAVISGSGGETTTFTMSADNTEWLFDFTAAFTTAASPALVKFIQQTGNTEAVDLVVIQAADTDVTPLRISHNGEDITVAYSAGNEMTVGSGTGVDTLVLSSMSLLIGDAKYIGSASDPDAIQIEADGDIVMTQDLAVTGILTGKLVTATDGDAHTLSVAEYHGGTVLATGAGIYTLPSVAAGYSGCVEAGQGVTAIIQLLPAAGDYIVHQGARGTAATAIASDGSAGDRICYRSYNADDWYVTTYGTWAE